MPEFPSNNTNANLDTLSMKLIAQISLHDENEVWRKLKTKANLHDHIVREIEDIETLRDSLHQNIQHSFQIFFKTTLFLQDNKGEPNQNYKRHIQCLIV
jgi:inorganic pyrophosphatase